MVGWWKCARTKRLFSFCSEPNSPTWGYQWCWISRYSDWRPDTEGEFWWKWQHFQDLHCNKFIKSDSFSWWCCRDIRSKTFLESNEAARLYLLHLLLGKSCSFSETALSVQVQNLKVNASRSPTYSIVEHKIVTVRVQLQGSNW